MSILPVDPETRNGDTSVKKTKIFFDVVNSVKGGSGKSTFSLLLAGFHALKQNRRTYIIDLDLRGTSWEKNYGYYIKTNLLGPDGNQLILSSVEDSSKIEEVAFIDKLMWNFEAFKNREFWMNIEMKKNNPGRELKAELQLAIGRTDFGNQIGQLEVDLFENAIYHIICNELATDHEGIEEIHFIFDMPPSYEQHAERVLKHLLTSENSFLWKSDPFEGYERYTINLYMVSAISPAHIEQNVVYLEHWLRDISFSSRVVDLISNERLLIRYVGNDVSNNVNRIAPKGGSTIPQKKLEGDINIMLDKHWNKLSAYTEKPVRIPSFAILRHMELDASDVYFTGTAPAHQFLTMPEDAFTFFSQILEEN